MEKVVFGFFVVLAATLNFGFFIGDLGNHELHSVDELFAAAVVNLIAAAVVWTYAANVLTDGALTVEQTAAVVSLSGGALFANVVSVVLLVVETVSFQRR